MIIVVDGNDGTGKSTLVERLRKDGYCVQDRGIPTKLTDDPSVKPNSDEFYIILDAPVEVCRERLKTAGRDLNEKYHTIKDLTYYRKRFRNVVEQLGDYATLIDADKNIEEVYYDSVKSIKERMRITKIAPIK